MDFNNKKVLIMGLGLHGGGVDDALFFIKQGAEVTITDLKTKDELKLSLEKLKDHNVKYTLGEHAEEDFRNTDIVIKNPGVPSDSHYLKIARKLGVKIYDSMGVFFEYADLAKLVGVTGTKGKSSVSTLLYNVLKDLYDKDAYLTGTPGGSPLNFADKARLNYGVAELSSWRLEGLEPHKKSPHIALITNIQEDHLNRYPNYDAYRESKKIIFKYQTNSDYLVLNYDDEYLRNSAKEAESQVVFYSTQKLSKNTKHSAYIHKNKLYVDNNEIGDIDKLGLTKTDQHMDNILAVLSVCNIFGIDIKHAILVILNAKNLPGRLEYVTNIDNIKIYNDTTATNPFSAARSVSKFSQEKTVLIAGGEDKGLNYEKLMGAVDGIYALALLPGSASDKIYKELKAQNPAIEKFQRTATLREALWWGYAQAPEVILLSPAAASFNMFKNEFDRGEVFIEEVKSIKEIINCCK